MHYDEEGTELCKYLSSKIHDIASKLRIKSHRSLSITYVHPCHDILYIHITNVNTPKCKIHHSNTSLLSIIPVLPILHTYPNPYSYPTYPVTLCTKKKKERQCTLGTTPSNHHVPQVGITGVVVPRQKGTNHDSCLDLKKGGGSILPTFILEGIFSYF